MRTLWLKDAAGKCVEVASSEAATGGQVGAAMIKVQHPLPAARLVSAVTHSLNPSRTSTRFCPGLFIFRCF